MERAHDRGAGHDTVAQRSALMRAFILNSQVAILQMENCDFSIANGHGSPLAYGNVFDLA